MRLSVAMAVACLSMMGLSMAHEAQAGIKKQTTIPAQGLGPALQQLAKERDIQFVYRSEVVGDRQTSGATGELTFDEALTQLLNGTGLTYQYLDDRAVTIVPAPVGLAPPKSSGEKGRPAQQADEASVSDDSALRSGKGEVNGEGEVSNFWKRFRLAQANPSPRSGEGDTAERGGRSGQSSDKNSESQPLAEVIVTAQKRGEERLQDVPVPVTVISGDSLTVANKLRIEDYYASIPGVNLVQNGFTQASQISIRGLSTGSTFQNTSVGPAIDDIPQGASTFWGGGGMVPDVDPGDLARIEVLRGPQGTIYGAGALGGLLNFITVDPSTDQLSGRFQLGTVGIEDADDLGYNVRGAVNVPVSDSFAIRASGFTRLDPGYIDNANVSAPEDDVNTVKGKGGRVSALWRLSDAVTLKLNALAQRTESEGSSDVMQSPQYGDLEQDNVIGSGGRTTDIQSYSAILTARLGQIDLTSLSGYSLYENEGINHADATTQYALAFETEKYSQEVRLDIPLGERVNWLIGGFYTKETTSDIETLQVVDPVTGEVTFADLLNPANSAGEYEEYAAFTNLTFQVTDRFDVQVGARQAHYSQEFHQTFEGFLATLVAGSSPFSPPPVFPKDDAFTYLLTPRFKVSPDLMVYARFASGYRTGGPNSNLANISGEFLPIMQPDTTRNYEVGIKGSFLDHKLAVDASVYYIDWEDIQLFTQAILPNGQPAAVYVNGDTAKSQGLELSLEARLWQGFRVTLAGALNTAELTADVPGNLLSQGQSGDRLPYSPRVSGSLSLLQELGLGGNLSGFVGGSVSYVGERIGPFNAANVTTPRATLPSYAQTDLNAGINYNSWDIGLYLNNVFDERGWIAVNSTRFQPIRPRSVGLNLTKRF